MGNRDDTSLGRAFPSGEIVSYCPQKNGNESIVKYEPQNNNDVNHFVHTNYYKSITPCSSGSPIGRISRKRNPWKSFDSINSDALLQLAIERKLKGKTTEDMSKIFEGKKMNKSIYENDIEMAMGREEDFDTRMPSIVSKIAENYHAE